MPFHCAKYLKLLLTTRKAENGNFKLPVIGRNDLTHSLALAVSTKTKTTLKVYGI